MNMNIYIFLYIKMVYKALSKFFYLFAFVFKEKFENIDK